MKDYNDGCHLAYMTHHGFTYIEFYVNVDYMRFYVDHMKLFSSWACEFLNWENFC